MVPPPASAIKGHKTMNQISPERDLKAPSVPQTEKVSKPIPDEALERHRRRTARWTGFGTALGLLLLVGIGTWTHIARSAGAEDALETRKNAVPLVRVQKVTAITTPHQVDLAGSMQAFDTATLYARATGYVGVRNVDIGSKVKKGDVLAIIAAPDLDQQLAQARAQLLQMQAAFAQAAAQKSLARVTNQRTSRLVQEGWDSRQQGDNDATTLSSQTAAVRVAQANIAAQLAQVNRLVELTGYEKVLAPFDGVITARNIDVGTLVTSDATSGTPMFSIAHNDVLRVQVYVPQAYVFGLNDGQDATITVPQLPGKTLHGRVARNAAALSSDTRTLLAEVDVNNADGALSPGLYGIVHLQEPRQNPVVTIPTQAVIFDQKGLSVAVVNDGKIELRHLDVDNDNGATLEIRSGLKDGDEVILSPPIDAKDGMKVRTS
jgi:RND family efflux transporter MFP subunit